ncbi:MAG: UvrD-helicase domain-containing protein [Spirochaetales bacterium]|nr:UvrD-helicase domain-containing protein [Spirochaetales bacterium]
MSSFKEQLEREILKPLSDVQREAVLHEGGPLLIVAGAGSGKTRVITHRMASLCRLKGVPAYRLAAVTFTNKAAREMQERLQGLIGPMSHDVTVKTFHGLGLYILRREASLLGLASNFTVYDADTQESLLKKILKEYKVDPALLSPKAAAAWINRARDELRSPEKSGDQNLLVQELPEIYADYVKQMRRAGALDFGDLIYLTVQLFQKEGEILEKYRQRFTHLLVDEYQDTNHAQYMLCRLIAGDTGNNLLVVGDEDQSIYSWRGADIRNILAFEKDYPGARVIKLTQNYRSTPQILRAAQLVIQNNRSRREKVLFTENPQGPALEVALYASEDYSYNGEMGEAQGVLARIRQLLREGYALSDIAIFYRTNAQSRSLETILGQENIPYRIYGGFRFYDRREIKDLMAYLAVICNPADDVSLARIINVPLRGIGQGSVEQLQAAAVREGKSLLSVLENPGSIRAAGRTRELHGHFLRWQSMLAERQSPSRIAEDVLKTTGYSKVLKDSGLLEDQSRLENLYEFIGALQNFEERQENPDLAEFLQSVSLVTSEENPDRARDQALTLMTLHNSKGLEFKVVFITGLEEGTFPHSLALSEGGEEEERRLMYVGITRARERLYLSGCRMRRVFGQMEARLPSRFLRELQEAGEKAARPVAQKQPGRAEHYALGERVRHKRYGTGLISSIEKTVAGQKIGLRFDGEAEDRFFLAAYTPLERISS